MLPVPRDRGLDAALETPVGIVAEKFPCLAYVRIAVFDVSGTFRPENRFRLYAERLGDGGKDVQE